MTNCKKQVRFVAASKINPEMDCSFMSHAVLIT